MRVRIVRVVSLIGLYSASAMAQGQGGGTNNVTPANVVWGIVAIIGAMASGFFALSLIWTSIQGAVADHDNFHKLPRIVFWAAICFSATFIAGRMALG